MVKYTTSKELSNKPEGLYEYVLAGNGLFVRAWRQGLAAQVRWSGLPGTVRGLPLMSNRILIREKAPGWILYQILMRSLEAAPNEILFWIVDQPSWKLIIPKQDASPGHVRPVEAYDARSSQVLIEVHSHGSMNAFFSGQDDSDETGFRIYAVIGAINRQPVIRCRVGIYGHFCEIPASWIFEIPALIQDNAQAKPGTEVKRVVRD